MDVVVYAVAVLLLVSVVLFIKAALFDRRPQKIGLLLAILAVPLYLVYYNDRWPFGHLRMRDVISPLDNLVGADSQFNSHPAPAALIGMVLLVHITVFQRVAIRRRLQRVHDPIATFFAGTAFAALVGGIIVSTFALGWIGAVVISTVFTLVYLGAIALVGAVVEVSVELSKLFLVWVKRKVFGVATRITRVSSWVSSLSGRLVSRALIDRIRADTMEQESIYLLEQESQDKKLYEAYLRDRARQRRLIGTKGGPAGDPSADAYENQDQADPKHSPAAPPPVMAREEEQPA